MLTVDKYFPVAWSGVRSCANLTGATRGTGDRIGETARCPEKESSVYGRYGIVGLVVAVILIIILLRLLGLI